MCSQESHQSLTRPEHFTRHTMEVEQACSAIRRGLGNVSVERAMESAFEALTLSDHSESVECTRMLRLVVEGDLRTAATS